MELVEPGDVERANEFTNRVVLLLKHDWERAKREASLWRQCCEEEPQRMTLPDLRAARDPNDFYHIKRNGWLVLITVVAIFALLVGIVLICRFGL